MSNSKYFADNKALWNARVPVHVDSAFYDVEAFLKGKTSLQEIELNGIGSVKDMKILHLQCHFGMDSMSLCRLGARETVGVDFSERAIEKANELRDQLGINARFVLSNVLSLDEVLDEKFDMVFTSYGTVGWLPELSKWGEIVDRFLKPGGLFYMADFHPTFYTLETEPIELKYGYFNADEPWTEETRSTYTDGRPAQSLETHYWNHSLSNIMQPFFSREYSLEHFYEYPFSPYNCFPGFEEVSPGRYALNKLGISFPHCYEMKWRKKE